MVNRKRIYIIQLVTHGLSNQWQTYYMGNLYTKWSAVFICDLISYLPVVSCNCGCVLHWSSVTTDMKSQKDLKQFYGSGNQYSFALLQLSSLSHVLSYTSTSYLK